uniref:SPT2 homolog N-terminal domain-containing protein n=1 Tax=Onchocerca volvulus TaxID=6282 RepID=A0A8R1TSB9_ONCVO
MDLFNDILKQASSNTKNASKEIKKIDEARQKIEKSTNVRLAMERKQSKIVKPPPDKPKFVIPKKKTKEQSAVDKSSIALFLKKKEEEKWKALSEKKKQKEELIKLRLQSYGGKANKKLAKQFGSTPIELQQKFGNNREHEEHLKKQQIREEEEADLLNSELRGGVVKALERKKVVEKIAGAKSFRNGPYRVAINKKNSLRHLMKEDSPGPSTSCISESKSRKIDTKVVIKRRLPPAESNFFSLMKKAEAIQSGKASPSPPPLLVPPPSKKKNPQNGLVRRDISENKYDRESKSKSASESNKKAVIAQRSFNAVKKMDNIQAGHAKEEKVPPSVSSGFSVTLPSRRYLPGDIRYQGLPPVRSQKSIRTDSNLLSTANSNMKGSNNKDSQARGPRRINEENRARAHNQRQDPSKRMMSREEAVNRFKAHERMRLEEQHRLEKLRQLRDDDLDEDIDDEEYDSEMDDFIDDSEFDEHLKRGDLEETLRLINPRYDKNRWKLRERMIDDRHMEASYRDIAREEKRSSRIGLIEDIREARCGKSVAL